jgi:hypothetical protein
MRRIGLAVLLTVSLFAGPLAVEGQQSGKVYRIGLIHVGLDLLPKVLDRWGRECTAR